MERVWTASGIQAIPKAPGDLRHAQGVDGEPRAPQAAYLHGYRLRGRSVREPT